MVRWLHDWFILSALVFLSVCMIAVVWTIWPLLAVRLTASPNSDALNLEALGAMGLLLMVSIGYIKLLRGK